MGDSGAVCPAPIMHHMKTDQRTLMSWWLAIGLTLLSTLLPLHAEVKFDKLEAGLDTYYDVTVTTKTANDIYIEHSKGFANIKVVDLTPEVQERLGFVVKKPKTSPSVALSLENLPVDPKYAEAKDQMVTEMQSKFETMGKNILVASIAVAVLFYLFICLCFHKICVKAATQPGLLVWLPILQMFPLLRAARMSPAWFLAWILPAFTPLMIMYLMPTMGLRVLYLIGCIALLNLAGTNIWCIRICKARNVSVVFGILLLVPFYIGIPMRYLEGVVPPIGILSIALGSLLLQAFSFLYLAFGPAGEVEGGIPSDPDYNAKRNQDTSFFYQT